ncbi:lytic transglycosylase domain-containing protein [Rouxiella badensis]|uniref:lytic transglycosylase domain-containing protein n=1 Tax=Rouxiella badensis TaxID=1646377 RepID=UPI0013EF178C|nr:lytic transglycosylase domain-containing protein [Rouxiella badensis]QII37515.1 lytic transglycosylase domain-containing protein [Rouxiella badensis]
MANVFDFQLKADDQVSQSIQNIDDAVKKLTPQLNDAQKVVQLGGRRSAEGLDEVSGRLEKLAKNARDGVQFVGDLVPPLKMVGGLTLGLGGLSTVINGVKSQIKEYADSGYKIDTTAKNISTTTRAYQELTGAMIENGATRDSADSAVTGLYQRANDALNGRDDPFNALLAQMGIKIGKTKEGMADVVKLMDDLNKAMLKQSPARQAVIAQVGGFSPDLLNFLRQSTDQVQRLKDQAQRDGLIFSDKDVQNALAFRNSIVRISAVMDGMKMKSQAWLGSDGEYAKAIKANRDYSDTHANDTESSFYHGDKDKDILAVARRDKKFKDSLSFKEGLYLATGYPDKEFKQKLNARYGPQWEGQRLQHDLKALYVTPPGSIQPPGEDGPLFSKLEQKYGLPQGTLNNVYQAESAGGKHMFSPAGAEGPFQFMPTTGQQYGLNNRADRMDTGKSADAAARYLSDLLKQFGGDMKKAIAAYNWGPGRVSSLGLDYAPKETRDYLNRVMPGLPDYYDASTGSDPLAGDGATSANNVNSPSEPNINAPAATSGGSANGGSDLKQVADVLSSVLKENKSEIELTLINDRTGERKKISGAGGKVTTAMTMP